MTPIKSLDELLATLKNEPSRRVAVAAGQDPNTIQAAARAAAEGIADVTLVGDAGLITSLCNEHAINPEVFTVVDVPDVLEAGLKARDMVRNGEAEVLMKGLISTGDYMKTILDKEQGLLPMGAVLSHVTVLELPSFMERHGKLLFVGDVAIIPRPDFETKKKILRFCLDAAHSFGIERPKAALIAATEKVSNKMRATVDARAIRDETGDEFADAIIDGPLALDVAISPEACAIKGLESPVAGEADVLVFPNIETGNVFYKAGTLLAGGRLAAAVVGTKAPCVLTSRADSEESKLLSIAFGCRLAGRS